jgi:hypothetical protein
LRMKGDGAASGAAEHSVSAKGSRTLTQINDRCASETARTSAETVKRCGPSPWETGATGGLCTCMGAWYLTIQTQKSNQGKLSCGALSQSTECKVSRVLWRVCPFAGTARPHHFSIFAFFVFRFRLRLEGLVSKYRDSRFDRCHPAFSRVMGLFG